MKKLKWFGWSMLFCLVVWGCGGSGSEGTTAPQNKLFFAVYMVGSDLESKHASGTNDLKDMVAGYQQLSATEQAAMGVLVAFGGAARDTWNGVRYADMECLVQDAADGVFGNDTCYAYQALITRAVPEDMSDVNSLIHFLSAAQTASAGYATVFMDFWDHGGSYLGYGNDENFQYSSLSVNELAQAFATTGFRPQIIGFDACLMASAEVFGKLYPHADYLVAAEESEPGHGWDYSLIFGNYPLATDALDLATLVVDSFIDSPAHAWTPGKTLSVIDTATYAAFDTALDSLSIQLEAAIATDFSKLIKSAYRTERYGTDGRFSMDLAQFLTSVRSVIPALSAGIDDVLDKLAETVVYAREDGTRPNANGISIFGMDNGMWTAGRYTSQNSTPSNWYAFAAAMMTHDDGDVTGPTLAVVDKSFCNTADAGTCYRIQDDFAVQRADDILTSSTNLPNTYTIHTMHSLQWVTGDYYFLSGGDRKILQVCSGNAFCFDAETFAEANLSSYAFKAIVQQQFSTVTANFSGSEFVDYWVSNDYYQGAELDPKDDGTIGPGDMVIPFRQRIFANGGQWYYTNDSILADFYTFSQAPTFSLEVPDGGTTPYILVMDAQNNLSLYSTTGVLQPAP